MLRPELNRVWASGDESSVADPGDEKYQQGWEAEIPTYQVLNFLQNKVDRMLVALGERGMFEWGSDINYFAGALTWNEADGRVYVSKVDSPDTALPPDQNLAQWEPSAVQLSRVDFDNLRASLDNHMAQLGGTNPHQLRPQDVGTYSREEIDAMVGEGQVIIDGHIADLNNPHSVTATQAGGVPVDGGEYTGPVTMGSGITNLNSDGTATIDATLDFLGFLVGNSGLGVDANGVAGTVTDGVFTPFTPPTPDAIGAVKKSGDTMTGPLKLPDGASLELLADPANNAPAVLLDNSSGWARLWRETQEVGVKADEYLGINDNSELIFHADIGGGFAEPADYKIFHEGFLPPGGVGSVNGVLPDAEGNVQLDAGDVGALPLTGGTVTGDLSVTGEIIGELADNFRIANDTYGTFLRNDGSTLYQMITAQGDPYGTWSEKRPWSVNLSTGGMTIGAGSNASGDFTVGNLISGAGTFASRIVCVGWGNAYTDGGIEVRGNGSSHPTIGFHYPGAYAGQIRMVDGATFQTTKQDGAYADLRSGAVFDWDQRVFSPNNIPPNYHASYTDTFLGAEGAFWRPGDYSWDFRCPSGHVMTGLSVSDGGGRNDDIEVITYKPIWKTVWGTNYVIGG